MARYLDVDPRTLTVSPQRPQGAKPDKLQRQIALHGKSMAGMPPVVVYEDPDGRLVIWDGVTRATRVAKLLPGTPITVIVIGQLAKPHDWLPTVGDVLP